MHSTGFFIGVGWANSCADQLFTNGWVHCLKPTKEVIEDVVSYSGGTPTQFKAKKKVYTPLEEKDISNITQLLQEDIEILEFLLVVAKSEVF